MLKFLFRSALLAGVGVLVWQNLPDLKRYLRIMRM
ncbi:hypothetical protein ABH930_002360 [Kitasatospora sp. GAS204A]|nr:hypothetical protein [Kitasatospora sp. GAS204B]